MADDVTLAFKLYILMVLTINGTGYILLVRYTRSREGPMYYSTTTVMLTEISKLLISLMILIKEHRSIRGMISDVYMNVICKPSDSFKMCIPSVIYAIQNNLAFFALSNLDAATYQVTYQLKVLTTAMFMVLMIGKPISRTQWTALLILFTGIALVQLDSANVKQDSHYNYTYGLVAIILSCLCSGFAGVYFEKVLKGSDTSLWIRNVQMYLFGIISAFIGVVTKDGNNIMEHGFLYGYNFSIYCIIGMASIGGLYTSVVVKYTDNIIKGFSTAVSIVASVICSYFMFGSSFGQYFLVGAGLVMLAIYLYSLPKPAPKAAPVTQNV
ncbi:CMP-sialic acid transporter-like [Anneissia japonica]|uniref:CMP-sialic acid transporter-like n=1 Tax=Anneissia japonica TaxID=1529436 RepID=UPI0014259E04|nr:CMP-sialic acid transporter-like [Anneissia japonica]